MRCIREQINPILRRYSEEAFEESHWVMLLAIHELNFVEIIAAYS